MWLWVKKEFCHDAEINSIPDFITLNEYIKILSMKFTLALLRITKREKKIQTLFKQNIWTTNSKAKQARKSTQIKAIRDGKSENRL